MKIYIELWYKGNRVDAYEKLVHNTNPASKTIKLDITSHVQAAHKATISRLIKKITTASKLPRTCRVCGCTDTEACPGGCVWVTKDLCSCCVEVDKTKKGK